MKKQVFEFTKGELMVLVEALEELKDAITKHNRLMARDKVDTRPIDAVWKKVKCADCGQQESCNVGQVFCRWPNNIKLGKKIKGSFNPVI